MLISEFSDQFDVLYNNITSNQAPGLNEYEKSLFLTKAEKEIVKNYFIAGSKGNTIGQGFDDSAKRQADFSILMKTSVGTCLCNPQLPIYTFITGTEENPVEQIGLNVTFIQISTTNKLVPPDGTYSLTYEAPPSPNGLTMVYNGITYAVSGSNLPSENCSLRVKTPDRIDIRSGIYTFPNDVFIVINETVIVGSTIKQVIPLRYDEYTRLMSKPFKYPLKNQAWRLMNSGEVIQGAAIKYVEVITNTWDTVGTYNIRYVRVPKPIIVANLGDLSIDGESLQSTECEIDPILHEDILQRAVELAKIAWTSTGQDNAQMVLQAGQRSE